VLGAFVPVMNLFDESNVIPDALTEGLLPALVCVA
jgi:hypothetical protein